MRTRILVVVLAYLLLNACTAVGGVYHKVLPGQTLYSISKTYDVDERYLARINGINDPNQLKAGQQLYIPGANQKRSVPVTVPSGSSSEARSVPPRGQTVAQPPATTKRAPPPATIAPSSQSPPVRIRSGRASSASAAVHKGQFIWPLRGRVLKRFGSKSGGALCKGLEIAAVPGAAVVSAAAGKVIYSGDGISGFGNLIIIRHDDSYFTVYGFNQTNLVSSGAFVSKGQQIARAGVPPKGGNARLYFEIRAGKKPVDPIFYLP